MFRFFYDAALFGFCLLNLPKWIWQAIWQGKYRRSFWERIGGRLPPFSPCAKDRCIWIHAVSLGETKAAAKLVEKIHLTFPETQLVISSITETGHKEAKRSMPQAEHLYLPLDFSWCMKRLMQRWRPNLVIIIESDFWWNFLHAAREVGAEIFLVSGKMSAKSAARFTKASFFTRSLFAPFSHFCVQNETYKERFLRLGISPHKISVTGNLKLDSQPALLSSAEKKHLKEELQIDSKEILVVLGSSHEGEESLLLQVFSHLWQNIPEVKLLLVPRHPERFKQVEKTLMTEGVPFRVLSHKTPSITKERVILIDKMGVLSSFYQIADLAIVGGSFVPGIGGHNIFEPIQCGAPVVFGPYMHTQQEFVDLILQAQAGVQIQRHTLHDCLFELLQDASKRALFVKKGSVLVQNERGALERTWKLLKEALSKEE